MVPRPLEVASEIGGPCGLVLAISQYRFELCPERGFGLDVLLVFTLGDQRKPIVRRLEGVDDTPNVVRTSDLCD